MQDPLTAAALIGVASTGAWLDMRTGRIPNTLTGPALIVGLALSLAIGGFPLLAEALTAAAVVLALGIPLFGARLLGGGDVKFAVALAALLRMDGLLAGLLLTAVTGAVLALVQAIRKQALIPVLDSCREMVTGWLMPGRVATIHSSTQVTVPYGIAIAVGMVLGGLL